MKVWYFIKDEEKQGPFTLDELIGKDPTRTTLVWNSEMTDWEEANKVSELNEYFKKTPPPTPREKQEGSRKSSTTFDYSRKMEGAIQATTDLKYISWKALMLGCWSILLGFAQFSGKAENWTFGKSFVFNSVLLFAFVTVFVGLKNYLNEKKPSNQFSKLISFLLISQGGLSILEIIFFKDEEKPGIVVFLLFVLAIISLITTILLSIKFIRDQSEEFFEMKMYGWFQLISIIGAFLLLTVGSIIEVKVFEFLGILISSIPYFYLFYFFKKVKG